MIPEIKSINQWKHEKKMLKLWIWLFLSSTLINCKSRSYRGPGSGV
jgi:hypothetical protein